VVVTDGNGCTVTSEQATVSLYNGGTPGNIGSASCTYTPGVIGSTSCIYSAGIIGNTGP
jgi:hypothetical protein